MEDHARGCEGRNYTCTCGYDEETERKAKAYDSMEPVAYRIYLPGWGEELSFTIAGAEEIAGNVEIVTERAAIITPLYSK